jgi:hypothetical protein
VRSCKVYAPRVEAETIDEASLGDMRAGVLWSGHLEYGASGQVANDPNNDYATVGSLSAVSVGPTSDLWIQSCPSTVISHDLFGELYLTKLEGNEVITIGDRLGQFQGSVCDCPLNGGLCDYYESALSENSPRSPGATPFGRIVFRDVAWVKGQVTINANGASNPDAAYWAGAAIVPLSTTPVSYATLSAANSTQPDLAPTYLRLFSDFRGGAFGEVPFTFKRNEFDPPSNCEFPPCDFSSGAHYMPIVSQERLEGDGIVLPAYGPMLLGTGVPFHLFGCDGWGHPIYNHDYATDLGNTGVQVQFTAHGVVLRKNPLLNLPTGRYLFRHTDDDQDLSVLCDHLLTTADIRVPGLDYNFVYLGAAADVGCDDYNGDGDHGTDADIEAFFACLAGSCCSTCGSADFDCDGDVGTDADILAFFQAMAGHCPEGC